MTATTLTRHARPEGWVPCMDVDPDLMFPEEHRMGDRAGTRAFKEVAIQEAKAVCLSGCSRFDRCLAEALERRDEAGVFAATTANERAAYRRRRLRAPYQVEQLPGMPS